MERKEEPLRSQQLCAGRRADARRQRMGGEGDDGSLLQSFREGSITLQMNNEVITMKKGWRILLAVMLILAMLPGACAAGQIRFEDAGTYTFYNKTANAYLSWQDRTVVLSSSPSYWTLEQAAGRGFYMYAKGTNLMLDIDNAYVNDGTTIKLWDLTGYDVQIWNLVSNPNGTYSILYSGDNRYCLGFVNGNAVLQHRAQGSRMQEWIVADHSAMYPKNFLTYTSRNGVIQLQLPLDVHRVISDSRLQQWANELETAFYTFYDLTSFKPYEYLVVKAYETGDGSAVGWVYGGSNIIHIDRNFLFEDLDRMARRVSDWNFCALHEMGHIFDDGRGWDFEGEVMTDLKVAYVMEATGAAAAPAEFDASTVFYGADIIQAYHRLGGSFSSSYNVYGIAERFLEIKNVIGWEPFRQTFKNIQVINHMLEGYSRQQKFEYFIGQLSANSGTDVKRYFSQAEWDTILRKLNQ